MLLTNVRLLDTVDTAGPSIYSMYIEGDRVSEFMYIYRVYIYTSPLSTLSFVFGEDNVETRQSVKGRATERERKSEITIQRRMKSTNDACKHILTTIHTHTHTHTHTNTLAHTHQRISCGATTSR